MKGVLVNRGGKGVRSAREPRRLQSAWQLNHNCPRPVSSSGSSYFASDRWRSTKDDGKKMWKMKPFSPSCLPLRTPTSSPGPFPLRCHSDMGIPIPKTLVKCASPVTLTQIAKVIWEVDAHITRILGMAMPITLWHRPSHFLSKKTWGRGWCATYVNRKGGIFCFNNNDNNAISTNCSKRCTIIW